MSQNRLLFSCNCQVFGFLTQNNFDFCLRDRLNGKFRQRRSFSCCLLDLMDREQFRNTAEYKEFGI
ncbi:hypothetical protein [Scytonema millei]|uniref:Uncharacterized protein n=1 Tax=Scytonema millei VB511283 TaxID=1245923 RepID=A0A9X5I362_9CYAN|nr:hypothetical protein [Scytonema millei]NHC33511.1 hypothetical protein [Scytonema millei VB511283]